LNDYGVGIWWEKDNQALQTSVKTANPHLLENALRAYHDRVVAAGGTLYMPVPNLHDHEQQQLAEALLATSGDLLCYCNVQGEITHPEQGIPALLKLKAIHPALYQNSSRRQIPTNDDNRFYATLRDAADHSERLLILFNFQPQDARIDVDLGAINGSSYIGIGEGQAPAIDGSTMQIQLPPYGHRLFVVK
jgi:hypothetical protein